MFPLSFTWLLCVATTIVAPALAKDIRSVNVENATAQSHSTAISANTEVTSFAATTSKPACSKGWTLFSQVTDSQCLSWLKSNGAYNLNVSCASSGGSLLIIAQKSYLQTIQSLFGEMWYDDDLNPVSVLLGVRYTNGRWSPPDYSSSLSKLVHADDPQCTGTSTSCPDKCLILKMKNETLQFGLESCTFPFKNSICSLTLKQS